MKRTKLTVSAPPHIVHGGTIHTIMFDVIVALVPACAGGCYFFGARAAVMILVSIIGCIAAETLVNHARRQPNTIGDFSAVVTGILLALSVPVGLPYWMLLLGDFFAIVIVKGLFGGLGCNFVNPALAGRAFLMASWAAPMTAFVRPFAKISVFSPAVDAVASATPLAALKAGEAAAVTPSSAFFGNMAGCLGETSAFLILAGAAYLIIREVISWEVPAVFLGSFAVLTFFFGKTPFDLSFVLLSVFSGGLMLGAFFMATDYVTSPATPRGKIIYAAGCGVLTFLIRRFGGYPEGVTYAILLMNIAAPLIEKVTVPKPFGEVKAK